MSDSLLDKLSPEDARDLLDQMARLKKSLKALSKNQLITLVIQQVNIAVEQQNINKVLLEKMKNQTEESKNA